VEVNTSQRAAAFFAQAEFVEVAVWSTKAD
jgi:hypothetical protein